MEKQQTGAFTIDGWCAHRNISRGTWYSLKRTGKAPRTYRVGAREYVSRDADQEWVREREAAESAESAAFRERRAEAGTGTTKRAKRQHAGR